MTARVASRFVGRLVYRGAGVRRDAHLMTLPSISSTPGLSELIGPAAVPVPPPRMRFVIADFLARLDAALTQRVGHEPLNVFDGGPKCEHRRGPHTGRGRGNTVTRFTPYNNAKLVLNVNNADSKHPVFMLDHSRGTDAQEDSDEDGDQFYLNQHLHLIVLGKLYAHGQLVNAPQLTSVQRCYKEDDVGIANRLRSAAGSPARLDGLWSQTLKSSGLVRDLIAGRKHMEAVWKKVPAARRARLALAAVARKGCCVTAAEYAATKPLSRATQIDFLNNVIQQLIGAMAVIDTDMQSFLNLSLETLQYVRCDKAGVFNGTQLVDLESFTYHVGSHKLKVPNMGFIVKLLPNAFSRFKIRLGRNSLGVGPILGFRDKVASGLAALHVPILGLPAEEAFYQKSAWGQIADLPETVTKFAASLSNMEIGKSAWRSVTGPIEPGYDLIRVCLQLLYAGPDEAYGAVLPMRTLPLLGQVFAANSLASLVFNGVMTTMPEVKRSVCLTFDVLHLALHERALVDAVTKPTAAVLLSPRDLRSVDPASFNPVSVSFAGTGIGDQISRNITWRNAYQLPSFDPAASAAWTALQQAVNRNAFGDVVRLAGQLPQIHNAQKEIQTKHLGYTIAKGQAGGVYRTRLAGRDTAIKIALKEPGHTMCTFTPLSAVCDPVTNELFVALKASELYMSGKCPNFIEIPAAYNAGKMGLCLVMETIQGDMLNCDRVYAALIRGYIEKGVPPPLIPSTVDITTNVVMQVMCGLIVFQEELGGMHNDLHLGNIFLKLCDSSKFAGTRLDETDFFEYKVGDDVYKVPNIGILAKIGDFGLTTMSTTRPGVSGVDRSAIFDTRLTHVHARGGTTDTSMWGTDVGKKLVGWAAKLSTYLIGHDAVKTYMQGMQRRTTDFFDPRIDVAYVLHAMRLHPRFQNHPLVFESREREIVIIAEQLAVDTAEAGRSGDTSSLYKAAGMGKVQQRWSAGTEAERHNIVREAAAALPFSLERTGAGWMMYAVTVAARAKDHLTGSWTSTVFGQLTAGSMTAGELISGSKLFSAWKVKSSRPLARRDVAARRAQRLGQQGEFFDAESGE